MYTALETGKLKLFNGCTDLWHNKMEAFYREKTYMRFNEISAEYKVTWNIV